MHEMALAEGILAIALEAAREHKVDRIHVQVGQLQHVTQDSLQFSFELISEGTGAAKALIEIQEVPARFRCRNCGREGEVVQLPLFQCLPCGSRDLEVISGEEILVESIELNGGVVIRNSTANLRDALEEHLKEHDDIFDDKP